MSTITQQPPHVASADPAHPVSEMIDATEVLYRLTVREYEQIAGHLDDDRVELIDGYMVTKMVKNPPHVIACRRADAAIARIAPTGWHTRAGDPIQTSTRTEPEPDVALVRGTDVDYENRHPGPNDIALVVEVADTSLLKDRRRRRIYGPAGIGAYWIVNLNSRKIEVYAEPNPDGYASRVDYAAGEHVAVVVDGKTIGTVAIADILP
jgi:Uma2 family endonuclease